MISSNGAFFPSFYFLDLIQFVLHDVEEEEKMFHLCQHSEKLAIAFGLINTFRYSTAHNQESAGLWQLPHFCLDHFKIVGRAIMVRNANCSHNFEDGVCSCMH